MKSFNLRAWKELSIVNRKQELEAEMRKESPAMFTHPGLFPGEVWIGDQAFEFAMINSALHRQRGMPSARFEEKARAGVMVYLSVNGVEESFPGYAMFVKLDELITVIEKRELEDTKEKPGV